MVLGGMVGLDLSMIEVMYSGMVELMFFGPLLTAVFEDLFDVVEL